MEDEKIIQLYWQRSEDAIAETAVKYGSYCSNISYGILRNPQDAEECVTDTYLRAWNTMPPEKPRYLAAFLGKIVRNLSLDRYRKNTALFRGGGQIRLVYEELAQTIPSRHTVETITEEAELTQILDRFLWSLPKEKRKVFLLRYWYFRSQAEISQQLGISEAKVRSMLHRLRKELKANLEQEGIHL